MTEREALLRAVCENPGDDTPRLVFADWLQEHGEDARAEFIRLQVQFAVLHRGTASTASEVAMPFAHARNAGGCSDPKALREQERAIWADHQGAFRAELPEIGGVAWFEEFHRGFVEIATITSDAQLVRYADSIFNRVPIQHLTITGFTAVAEFAHLSHLRRLRTLKLINPDADASIVRRLMLCDQIGESTLLFVQLGRWMAPRLQDELRRVFADRVSISFQ